MNLQGDQVRSGMAEIDAPEALRLLDRETLEHRLRESEGHFQGWLQDAPVACHEVDRDGLIVCINRAESELFGFSPEEMMGRPIWDFMSTDDRAKSKAGLLQKISGERPLERVEREYKRRDGSSVIMEVHATRVFDPDGQPVGLRTFLVDITERKRAEQALMEQAGKLARSNAELEQFAYVASHDLQEPLRKMAVYADLLEQAIAKSELDEVARAARVIASSAVRARTLVKNGLAFSQATSGETHRQPLDLRAEVEVVLSDLSASIEETRAQVSLDIPPITVPADHAQFGRLIQNIVSNAVKYHKPGAPPAIDIRAKPVGEAKAELSIADDGIGFDENLAREIFQPFKRLENTAQYAGTGIGLAICKSIADQHGWTIGVRSRPGEGSTFTVTLRTVG